MVNSMLYLIIYENCSFVFSEFFVDNYTYQENLLPKYHKMAGHDVTIIASLVSFSEKGKPIICLVNLFMKLKRDVECIEWIINVHFIF